MIEPHFAVNNIEEAMQPFLYQLFRLLKRDNKLCPELKIVTDWFMEQCNEFSVLK